MNFSEIFDPKCFLDLLNNATYNRKEVEKNEPNLESMGRLFAGVEVVIGVIAVADDKPEFRIVPLKGGDIVKRSRDGDQTIGTVTWSPVLVYSTVEAEALSKMYGAVSASASGRPVH